jgi:hypothetical protein
MVVRDVVVTVPETLTKLVVIWASVRRGYQFLLDSQSPESSSRKSMERAPKSHSVPCIRRTQHPYIVGLGHERAKHVCRFAGNEGVGCDCTHFSLQPMHAWFPSCKDDYAHRMQVVPHLFQRLQSHFYGFSQSSVIFHLSYKEADILIFHLS